MKTDTTPTAPVLDPLQKCSARIKASTEQGRAEYTRICQAREAYDRTNEPRSVNGPVAAECRSLLEHRATQERLRDACVRFDLATYTGDLLDRADGAKELLTRALDHVTSSTSTDDAPPLRPRPIGGPVGQDEKMNIEAELVRLESAIREFPWTLSFCEITSALNKVNAELVSEQPRPAPLPNPSKPFLVKERSVIKQADNYGTGRAPVVQPPNPAPRQRVIVNA